MDNDTLYAGVRTFTGPIYPDGVPDPPQGDDMTPDHGERSEPSQVSGIVAVNVEVLTPVVGHAEGVKVVRFTSSSMIPEGFYGYEDSEAPEGEFHWTILKGPESPVIMGTFVFKLLTLETFKEIAPFILGYTEIVTEYAKTDTELRMFYLSGPFDGAI